jgi:hypothetical protein
MINSNVFLKVISSFVLTILIISCDSKNNRQNEPVNSEIDKKYLEYLNDYYPTGLGNHGEKVVIKRIVEKTYWVTFDYGSGTKSEIYWLLDKNQLIPKFKFEYGGMDWTKELSYTFINIKESKTISGNIYGIDCENKIEILKEKFIADAE